MRTFPRALMHELVAVALMAALSSCFRLDSFFYYNPTKVSGYQLGAYRSAELYNVNDFLPDSAIAGRYSLVSFTAKNGNALYGYHLQHTVGVPASTTILYCHGDAYNLDQYWERAKLLYAAGADVLIFDYEGYGMSQGSPSETALEDDGFAALGYLLGVGTPMSTIVFYGYSLGSVPAVWGAANYTGTGGAKGIILEAPVGSAALFVQNATDLPLPAGTVTNLVIDNAQEIKKVTIPYYWLQGDHDSTIQYDTQGQAVYDNYGGTYKFKTIVSGADHTDVPSVLGGTNYSNYLGLVTSFITSPTTQPRP